MPASIWIRAGLLQKICAPQPNIRGLESDAHPPAKPDRSLLPDETSRLRIRARRPDLYGPLTVPTGLECDTRKLKFGE